MFDEAAQSFQNFDFPVIVDYILNELDWIFFFESDVVQCRQTYFVANETVMNQALIIVCIRMCSKVLHKTTRFLHF